MDCLLIGGAPSVGKSIAIISLSTYLKNAGYLPITVSNPTTPNGDILEVLEGLNKVGKKVRIIINSATDTKDLINNFKAFFDAHGSYDILISSVRDDDFCPRPAFFRIMNISSLNHFILEIPLAKITRRNNNSIALNWYQSKMDILLEHTVTNLPFNL